MQRSFPECESAGDSDRVADSDGHVQLDHPQGDQGDVALLQRAQARLRARAMARDPKDFVATYHELWSQRWESCHVTKAVSRNTALPEVAKRGARLWSPFLPPVTKVGTSMSLMWHEKQGL